MNRKTVCFLSLVFVSLATLLVYAQESLPEETAVQSRALTPAERLNSEPLEATPGGGWPWQCNPDLYGFTDPPEGKFRFPSEYEQTAGVILGWPSYGCSVPELTEIIRNAIQYANVWVMVSDFYRPTAISCLRSRGFSDKDLALINFVNVTVDTIWDRDYGPEILNAEDGSKMLIDMSYYPGLTANCATIRNRPNDDASPTRLDQRGIDKWTLPLYRPQLRAEGGNLQTDGNGTCFRLRRDTLLQNQFSEWRYTEEELNAVYSAYYNCNVVVLESLQPFRGQRNIDHIDMFMTVISPTKILLGQYDPDDDPVNAAILDQNAATLEAYGYTVVRIPQPKHYCTVHRTTTCQASPGDARECSVAGTDVVWATYANSIRIGNSVLVPVYHDVPASMADTIAAQEAEALDTFQRELDIEYGEGAVQVIPIVSDSLIPCLGSLHCITMTYN